MAANDKTYDLMADPAYRQASDRWNQLGLEVTEAEHFLEVAQGRLKDLRKDAKSTNERAAEMLANGEKLDPSNALAEAGHLERQIGDARARLAVLRRAREIARGNLNNQGYRVSVEICAAIKPELSAKLRKAVAATLDTIAAQQEIRAIYNDLDAGGVTWCGHLGPCDYPRLRQFEHIEGWLSSSLDDRLISPREIRAVCPASLREDCEKFLTAYHEMRGRDAA